MAQVSWVVRKNSSSLGAPGASVTVEGVSMKDGAVTGHFKTTRSALKIPEACMPPVNVPCVKDDLEVDATIYVKE